MNIVDSMVADIDRIDFNGLKSEVISKLDNVDRFHKIWRLSHEDLDYNIIFTVHRDSIRKCSAWIEGFYTETFSEKYGCHIGKKARERNEKRRRELISAQVKLARKIFPNLNTRGLYEVGRTGKRKLRKD